MGMGTRFFLIILGAGILALFGFCPQGLFAAQDDSRVIVSVASIDELRVGDAFSGIHLTGAPGSNALTGAPDSSARLSYVHNASGNRKITAQVLPGHMPGGDQDITLTVAVSHGAEQTIVQQGVALGAKDVLTGIPPGDMGEVQVAYGASATASGCSPGDYRFTVTFTSLDDE